MASDKHCAFRGHVIGDAHGLLGIAGIVPDGEPQSLPEHAAFGMRSVTARSAPRRNCSPNAALLPVIGPATPMVMSASAAPVARLRIKANKEAWSGRIGYLSEKFSV